MQKDFVPVPQPDLITYLERLLERARAGEVQYLVASAGVTPAGEATGFDVLAYAALGDRPERWKPTDRRATYASMLEGLAKAASELDRNFQRVTPPLVMPS